MWPQENPVVFPIGTPISNNNIMLSPDMLVEDLLLFYFMQYCKKNLV